jgi:hypothetical protein
MFTVSSTFQILPGGAAVLAGKTCTSLNAKRISSEKLYICVKSGAKKVWDSGRDLVITRIEMLDFNALTSSIHFSFLATRGDICVVKLGYGQSSISTRVFDQIQTGPISSFFEVSANSGLARLAIDCRFSGMATKSVRLVSISPSSKPSPANTSSPMPSPSPTPSEKNTTSSAPSASSNNPFSDAAAKAAAEAAAKKKAEEDKARLLEEEREKQRQANITQELNQLLQNYCGARTSCDVGKKGAGGGLIFFHALSPQWWGTYMEVRVTGIESTWCDKPTLALTKNVLDPALRKSIGKELGKGKQNTNLMLAACSSGAANVASSFRGGGFDDWYLPSYKELDQICKFAAGTRIEEMHVCHRSINQINLWGYFPSVGEYWSSSEYTDQISPEGNFAWFLKFFDGTNGPLDKKAIRPVLAVRAYGPKSE